MIYLLDTNAIRDLTDNNANVQRHLRNLLPTDRAIVCPIVQGEVLFGIERTARGRRREELTIRTARVLNMLPCEPITLEAANYYAEIKARLESDGRSKANNDLWIAATALALDAILVTRDSDFQDVEGLSVEDWTA